MTKQAQAAAFTEGFLKKMAEYGIGNVNAVKLLSIFAGAMKPRKSK